MKRGGVYVWADCKRQVCWGKERDGEDIEFFFWENEDEYFWNNIFYLKFCCKSKVSLLCAFAYFYDLDSMYNSN